MMVDSKFNDRLDNLFTLLNPILQKSGKGAMHLGEWGMVDDMNGELDKIKDLQILFVYLLMVDWETYEQNTFHLANDIDGCPIIKYPSQIADEETVKCICTYFDCKYNMDITKVLRPWAMYPLGEVPEGISFDSVDNAIEDCDDDYIFEINKE